MIRLASLASWAARKTCIKGVLRRECRFGLFIQLQSQGGDPSGLEHAGNSGDRFFRKTVLENSGRVDGSHPLVSLVRVYASLFFCRSHPKPTLSFPEPSSFCARKFGFTITKSSEN